MKVQLAPLAKFDASLLSMLDRNFRELGDALARLSNVEIGQATVNGSLQIDTGLAEVYAVQVSLAEAPTSTACFVSGELVGSSFPRNILIKVFRSDFVQASVNRKINWMAIGE